MKNDTFLYVSGVLQGAVVTICITEILGSFATATSGFGWGLYLEIFLLVAIVFLLSIEIITQFCHVCCEYKYNEIKIGKIFIFSELNRTNFKQKYFQFTFNLSI